MKKYFGGTHLENSRKTKRPLDPKKPHHFVLRLKPNLPCFFNPRDKALRSGFHKVADKYGVQIYQLVFNHSHVHLILSIHSRESYVGFIRELTSKLVSYFSKKWRMRLKGIFANRPFSRIATWGRRSIQILNNYMRKNEKESGCTQLFYCLQKAYEKLQTGQLEFHGNWIQTKYTQGN